MSAIRHSVTQATLEDSLGGAALGREGDSRTPTGSGVAGQCAGSFNSFIDSSKDCTQSQHSRRPLLIGSRTLAQSTAASHSAPVVSSIGERDGGVSSFRTHTAVTAASKKAAPGLIDTDECSVKIGCFRLQSSQAGCGRSVHEGVR